MANLIVVGAQWGDEGKGKVVDLLSERFDVIARYQGGHNAGHTVRFADQHFSLRLVPSGILHPGKICVIGNGLVVDLAALIEEIDMLRGHGVSVEPNHLKVSEHAHVILPYHRELDRLRESSLADAKIGTTGRGIGPAYENKMARDSVRLCDLREPELLREKIAAALGERNVLIASRYGAAPLDGEAIAAETLALAARVLPFLADTSALVNRAMDEGKNVLIEGAQGTLLDIDHGTYPFVTSSNAVAGGACTGLGIGPTRIDSVLGVIKAYVTRVGSGPFPTEMEAGVAEQVRQRGNEYGTNTGRPRRCGWFDALAVRYAVRVNGLEGLALMKLDVLDQLDIVPVCTGYVRGNETVEDFPADSYQLASCTPRYEFLPGWNASTVGITQLGALPQRARAYVERLEMLGRCPIRLISTGPRREETILEGFAQAFSAFSDPPSTVRKEK